MDPNEYKKLLRKIHERNVIGYRRARLQPNNEKVEICPQCGAHTEYDMDRAEIYCTDCGLIVKASIPYVGNKFISYPYGTLLWKIWLGYVK